ncbi:MAG: cation:proton antiporter [Fuerstiella sp.]
MASAIVPEVQQKYGRRRALSWRIIVGFACFTLLWWVSQPGVLFRTGSTGTAAVASQPTGTEPTQLTNEPTTTGHESVSEKHADGHKDPVAEVLLAILIILLLAKISGDVFERLGMPAVLGELSVGIILGNWALFTGSHDFDFFKPFPTPYSIPEVVWTEWVDPKNPTQAELRTAYEGVTELSRRTVGDHIILDGDADDRNWRWQYGTDEAGVWQLASARHEAVGENLTGTVLDMLSRIGVVLLLFEVGLEARVKEMASVGVSSLLVALIGVIAPMALGFGVGYLLVSEDSSQWQVPAFLGATLCATSVGITARVLKDMDKSKTRESSIILGAAVIDDVLGLVVLAVVSGVIREGDHFEVMSLFRIVGLSLAFLAGALILGALQLPRYLFKAASFLRGHGLLVTTALMICFLFSWAANHLADLAPIIGAFAAGLILEGAHYQEVGEKWKNRSLEDALAPLTALLVPIFFVATGIAVDLSMFSGADTWILAIGLTIVAIIGKLVCAWGVREPGINKQAVGLGMIPRGEVGLIFAGVGRELKTADGHAVIDDATFSAIVVMVMITTMITPPMLKWSLGKTSEDSTPR